MQQAKVLGLVKFLRHEHVEDFRRGRLYMNPLRHFVQAESNPVRRDEREGHDFWLNGGSLSVRIGDEFVPIPGIDGPIGADHDGYPCAACAAT